MAEEYQQILTDIRKLLSKIDTQSKKEFDDIKKTIKLVNKKIADIYHKIQEFEIILDAAELIEDQMEDKYNTEWNPYDYEEYEAEQYEQYDEDEDEDF